MEKKKDEVEKIDQSWYQRILLRKGVQENGFVQLELGVECNL